MSRKGTEGNEHTIIRACAATLSANHRERGGGGGKNIYSSSVEQRDHVEQKIDAFLLPPPFHTVTTQVSSTVIPYSVDGVKKTVLCAGSNAGFPSDNEEIDLFRKKLIHRLYRRT